MSVVPIAASVLTAPDLIALRALEREVVEHDGGRLKLEWASLERRTTPDVVARDGARLVGFAGVYVFGSAPEITGMVAPAARGAGLGAALLDAALRLAADRSDDRPLLVVPRPSEPGRRLAVSRGGVLHHSEHALVLHGDPAGGQDDPATVLRPASAVDASAVGALLAQGFGFTDEPDERTWVAERDGRVVGTVRLSLHDGLGGVYGFVVEEGLRGRGIGRDVLRRSCLLLRSQGATSVRLEVETANENALGLYTSTGFEPVATEDYYRLIG